MHEVCKVLPKSLHTYHYWFSKIKMVIYFHYAYLPLWSTYFKAPSPHIYRTCTDKLILSLILFVFWHKYHIPKTDSFLIAVSYVSPKTQGNCYGWFFFWPSSIGIYCPKAIQMLRENVVSSWVWTLKYVHSWKVLDCYALEEYHKVQVFALDSVVHSTRSHQYFIES